MVISKRAGAKKAGRAVPGAGASSNRGIVKADWREGFKKPQAGVSDMTLLTQITNDAINQNLQKRFANGEIYTYIGNVLISVNPFRDLGIYTDAILESYRGKNRLEMAPHVYAIAEGAYYNMLAYQENQCVIISGESGAGKTEAAKRIMQYIAAVSGDSAASGIHGIKDMVLATNPLLESFGCAKTLRNNNSSRHGKYLEIMFDAQGQPVGANITNYLLEKGRVVGQIRNERNFHIFYQFTKGATPQQREMFGLQGPEAYTYTADSKCLDVPGIDDTADFHAAVNAMHTIGLTEAEQTCILRMLAAILWLGNVSFAENAHGDAEVANPDVPSFLAYLLEVDAAAISRALTERIMETQRGGRRGSVYQVPLNTVQAAAVRDALSKAIYNNLFEWIVSRINVSLNARVASNNVIGVLDIYGFEIFENNSFEQLCINYVNEKLQQIFIELTLKKEQEEYAQEQIQWTPIDYFNNKIVCDLIEEKRPPGIFSTLNDAVATAHADSSAADSSFMQRSSMLSSNPHFEARGNKFLIRHYAGDVMYNVQGMTDKNKDALLKDILNLVDSSSNQFLKGLFPDRPDPESKKRPPSAGDRIKQSANLLVENLMRAQPSYIRTIKPNQNKSPSEYDTQAILHQIKYLGLQENIRVRRAGFAYRNTFEKIVQRFYLLSPATSYAGEYIWQGDARSGCERICIDTGIPRDEWQLGVSKGFIKNPETLFALETMRDRYWHNMAMRIQRAFRGYMRYKHECARRIQRVWRRSREGNDFLVMRDYGTQILAGRKERRRFSLVSMRRFLGDYLDVNGGAAEGRMLRAAAGISNGEPAVFSARAQLLVSRLGRTSRPSPRFLIMTNHTVYILVTHLVNKMPQTVCERRIPLTAIRSIGLSTLRDDWVILNTGADEGDPLLHLDFKTEFVSYVLKGTHGSVHVNIAPQLEYMRKGRKKAHVAFKKDESIPRGDVYKSSTVFVPSGEPPNSVSRPPARKKPGAVRPVTQGRLLRPGGPGQGAAGRSVPAPAQRRVPAAQRSVPAPVPSAPRGVPAAPATRSMPPSTGAAPSVSSGIGGLAPPTTDFGSMNLGARAVPAAPAPAAARIPTPAAPIPTPAAPIPTPAAPIPTPAAPIPTPAAPIPTPAAPIPTPAAPIPTPAAPIATPAAPIATSAAPIPAPTPSAVRPPARAPAAGPPRYRALYPFDTAEQGELPLQKGDIVTLEEKEPSGWWLARKDNVSGWVPADYLELVKDAPPPPAAKPRPPAPPKPSASTFTSSWTPSDSNAAPVAVMPGMGEPGGFAAVLARKRAANAASAANGAPPS
ncbi:Myo1p [Malassezia vespertilionis]|uniref:Myo1p n=1 Tax=Malassezia vespertilionis TaxID=2020962 RepID=A0A2N1J9N9_9BASI|nr:Myo1p [Malassezia vespertilionis]